MLAVDLGRLDERALHWPIVRAGIPLAGLPLVTVEQPSVRDAVISWRWDCDGPGGRSRNVALALLHARERGARYVFLDFVSVDQTAERAQLLQGVIAYSRLYAEIPVISAYDLDQATPRQFQNALRRPWILHELRLAIANPTSITHVGFASPLRPRRELTFENQLWIVKGSGMANVIYDLLHGTVEMTNVEDLALILPEFAGVLRAAFEKLPRHDYLLTAYLLTAFDEPGQIVSAGAEETNNGKRLNYDAPCFDQAPLARYGVAPSKAPVRPYEFARDLVLDGAPVAIWRNKMTSSYDRNWVLVLPEGQQRILDALDLPPDVRRRFAARQAERRASLYVDRNAAGPDVFERLASAEEGRWVDVPDTGGQSLGFQPKRRRSGPAPGREQ